MGDIVKNSRNHCDIPFSEQWPSSLLTTSTKELIRTHMHMWFQLHNKVGGLAMIMAFQPIYWQLNCCHLRRGPLMCMIFNGLFSTLALGQEKKGACTCSRQHLFHCTCQGHKKGPVCTLRWDLGDWKNQAINKFMLISPIGISSKIVLNRILGPGSAF